MFLFLLVLLTGPEEVVATPIPASPEETARVLASYFPRVEGVVMSVEKDHVTINVGKERGMIEGLVLTIYREESEFFHPLTGRPLGKFEKKLGVVEVDHVEDSLSRGLVLSSHPADPVRRGDRVRMTSGRLPLRVIAESGMDPPLLHTLLFALKETGRFHLITGEEEGEADYLLFLSPREEAVSLELVTAARRGRLAVMEVLFSH